MSGTIGDNPLSAAGSEPDRVLFGEIPFDNVTLAEAIERIASLVRRGGSAQVVTPNVDHVIRMRHDQAYRSVIADADLILADGQPIVWATRLLGRPLKTRVAGSDLFPAFCGYAAEHGLRVFFLGGDPGAAEAARDVLTKRHPDLQVVGIACPPFGFEKDAGQVQALVEQVRAAEVDVLFVGLGSPKQEFWLQRYLGDTHAKVGIGIGISFSFVGGSVRRAPRWMQRIGLEWFHRLVQEPGKLAYRYLVRGWGFLPIVVRECLQPARQLEEKA